MTPATATIRGDRLVFSDGENVWEGIESRLKRRYSRGMFIQDTVETPSGGFLIQLGSAYPKDVSDSRDRDNVLKFINVGDVETLLAEPTGEGYYMVDLPERKELHGKFLERKEEIIGRLDWSMAKAIYEDIYQLNPVRNQLNSIIEIVGYLQRESPIDIDRLDQIQGRANTRDYLRVLSDFDFVRLENGEVGPGEKMEAVDMDDRSTEDYEKQIVGQIINDAYFVLREELNLRMLSHFPKYANAYYFSAIQKHDPELTLDMSSVQYNLSEEWNDEVDPLVLDRKMRQLDEVDVIDRDGDFITGYQSIYAEVSRSAEEMALAD